MSRRRQPVRPAVIEFAVLDVGVISNALGGIAFFCLTVYLLVGWRNRPHGAMLTLACAVNAAWCFVVVAGLLQAAASGVLVLSEIARDAAWLFVIVWMLRQTGAGRTGWPVRLPALILPAVLGAFFLIRIGTRVLPEFRGDLFVFVAGTTAMALCALILLEQLYRSAGADGRWGLKYVCLALGALFVYDFLMYSYSLLGQHIPAALWEARGAVNALVAPLIAISATRKSSWSGDIQISRTAVFHTGAMIGCGGYLLVMALGGYFVRALGGTWGGFLLVVFCVAALLLLLVMLLSGQFRAGSKVFFTKHFFSYKYDYREEWLNLTQRLSGSDEAAGPYQRSITAVAHIMDSPAGALWLLRDGAYVCVSDWNMSQAGPPVDTSAPLAAFLDEHHWIVDLREYQHDPSHYDELRLPQWLLEMPRARLVIPLLHEPGLLGFVLLEAPRANYHLTWEDLDLLKTISRQVGSFLSQHESSLALAQARQFEAYNRLTAFLMHDLKNITAQQSLIVKNAQKHKDNPEFVDDMILTVESSVNRMQALLQQLRRPTDQDNSRRVHVQQMLQQAVDNLRHGQPAPQLHTDDRDAFVTLDPERFSAILANVIGNAQEATGADGRVDVHVAADASAVRIRIEDNGVGMAPEFVRESLFRPFYTTKSSRGMGIGAYQARELVRAAGGEVEVASAPDQGTVFTIVLPLAADQAPEKLHQQREASA